MSKNINHESIAAIRHNLETCEYDKIAGYDQFRHDLFCALGVRYHAKRHLLFQKAWEMSAYNSQTDHRDLYEVILNCINLVDLIR